MNHSERLHRLAKLEPDRREAFLARWPDAEARQLRQAWDIWGRPAQHPPPGDWRLWLVIAGRGFGKTRAGAEWVRKVARNAPGSRIALVAANLGEARSVMVEGDSGVLAVTPAARRPVFEPSLRRLVWDNGTIATLYSAAEPDSLRGPQHSHAWCDEIAKWDHAGGRAVAAWDNLAMGLRRGERPRTLATTTPRAVPLLRRLLAEAEAGAAAGTGDIVLARGTTWDNARNLPTAFMAAMGDQFGDTALGRQELDGELLADMEGALWSRALLERCRADPTIAGGAPPDPPVRVVVGVDPPASATGDACGIVVAGRCESGRAVVLADASVMRAGPERWARAVADAAHAWAADRVVAEANQGGAMVGAVLRAADIALPVRLVHASRGKAARAEPVAALYEAGRVIHAGMFPQLEDELCGLMAGGTYAGPGRSPDRADAAVWALTELMLGRHAGPRVIPL